MIHSIDGDTEIVVTCAYVQATASVANLSEFDDSTHFKSIISTKQQ